MIRIFIALQTPINLQCTLVGMRQVYQNLPLAFRWVNPQQLHLTLKFLGDVSEQRIPEITQAMQSAVQDQAPFTLSARGLGCFPSLSRPRVFWMGLEDVSNSLVTLQQRLDTALATYGFPCDSIPFHPHLTLARIRKPTRCPQFQELLQIYREQYFGAMLVDRLHLFQSQLHRTGVTYTIMRSVLLRRMKMSHDFKARDHGQNQ